MPGMCFIHVERKCSLDDPCVCTMRVVQVQRLQHSRHPVQGKQVLIWTMLFYNYVKISFIVGVYATYFPMQSGKCHSRW